MCEALPPTLKGFIGNKAGINMYGFCVEHNSYVRWLKEDGTQRIVLKHGSRAWLLGPVPEKSGAGNSALTLQLRGRLRH